MLLFFCFAKIVLKKRNVCKLFDNAPLLFCAAFVIYADNLKGPSLGPVSFYPKDGSIHLSISKL